MVVDRSNVDHIMRGLQSTEGVRLHNHRKKLRQRFDIIKKLGQGTYGKVQLGINKETGQEVAIKTIKKCKIETDADLVRIRREIQIMSSVRHPNIIHIYEVFENREKIVLVMEYAAGGELYDYLSERKVLEETEARRIFRQISTAIYYCHKHKICHRDLKLENILLDENGNAKIADFGLSNVFDGQRLLSTYCGSPLYASPEIVKGTPYSGPEVDCWSLGVLLYTLVYGAMPFDGSNFKRLVKQISQGDYYEPKKASAASPLIRDMLTVTSTKRATIEQICSHWWVNQTFNVSCLDIAEDLANQTPVRLDLLLSLAPPPENTEKIVIDDQRTVPQEAPPRSMSAGSFMELDQNAEERVRSFVAREVPEENALTEKTMKRKLEPVPSKSFSGARKKERTKPDTDVKEEESAPAASANTPESAKKVESNNVIMDIDPALNASTEQMKPQKISAKEDIELDLQPPQEVDIKKSVVKSEVKDVPEKQATEPMVQDKPTKKSIKVVKKKVVEKKDLEPEKKDQSSADDLKAMPKKKKTEPITKGEEETNKGKKEGQEEKEVNKEEKTRKELLKEAKKSPVRTKANEKEEKEKTPKPEDGIAKPAERRKSKIFETAEKFMTNEQKSPTQEKPKKVYIPGVKVSDFAKAFERKSSIPTATVKSSPSKKALSKESSPVNKKPETGSREKKSESPEVKKEENSSSQTGKIENESVVEVKNQDKQVIETKDTSPDEKSEEDRQPTPINDEKLKKLKDSARNIIANALVEEEKKKVKKQVLKPPVPKTKAEDVDNRKKNLTLQIGKETATVQVHSPENTKFLFEPNKEAQNIENKENLEKPKEKKTSKLEITLKSNTLPRRTSKAEVHLASPPQTKESGNFRTEVEHRVGDPSHVYSTQRSEVAFPVSAATKPVRSMSLEPEGKVKQMPKREPTRERIIPIYMEDSRKEEKEPSERFKTKELDRSQGKAKSPYQRTLSLRSNSLSRQSTQDSDTESTMSTVGEPIRKSSREVIIPIAVEGGGYVTPRATSLEPSESMSSKRSHRLFSRKFSLWSDNGSEDESPFPTMQRHSSRDMDEPFRMHRLRSSRPARPSAEKGDSGSGSEEEEEDDDGFELLTAENLFSTLLSRVRSLTQRLNVEDNLRPGFPSSRLFSNHFGPSERLFSNLHQPITRLSERPDFGRYISREGENGSTRWSRGDMTDSEQSRSFPRGSSKSKRSDSDTESLSENSYIGQQPKQASDGENREKKKLHHTRTKSVPVYMTEEEKPTKYSPSTFEGKKYVYVPSKNWTGFSYEKDGVTRDSVGRSGIPKLLRPTSLLLEKRRTSFSNDDWAEDNKDSNLPKVKDFYDILAEKYGITNVKRYDLPLERRDWRGYRTDLTQMSMIDNRVGDNENNEQDGTEIGTQPKKEDTLQEKYKAPSEKLAEVLSRLESRNEKPKEKAIDNNKIENGVIVKPRIDDIKEHEKSKIPKKVSRRQSDMTLKEFENAKEREKSKEKSVEHERKTPENSVLGKYLRCYSMDERTNTRPKEETKSTYFTSLERKLERLRMATEKKYVDKAIRSLRESSVGPQDVSSENVLIKRAVSVADCQKYKSPQQRKNQSTVNSVIGMFNKIDDSRCEEPETVKQNVSDKSKIPIVKKSEMLPKIEIPERTKPKEPCTPHYTRRSSYIAGNLGNFSKLTSPPPEENTGFLSPDSESVDSWSISSDLGNPEDPGRNYAKHVNTDDASKESVSDRIRRKSFYMRFNEKKRPRRSCALSRSYDSEADGDLMYNRSFSVNPTESWKRPSYYRSISSGDERRTNPYEGSRPKPFYRATGNDIQADIWPRTRSSSQSPSYSSFTLPRNFSVGDGGRSMSARFDSRGLDADRPFSPVRLSTSRAVSPFVGNQNPDLE